MRTAYPLKCLLSPPLYQHLQPSPFPLPPPLQVREWLIASLPNDSFSIENGIIVANARRWPLCIDPQGQANKWIKNLEKTSNLQVWMCVGGLDSWGVRVRSFLHVESPMLADSKRVPPHLTPQVIKLSEGGEYLRTLENAIQFGLPVLLENVGTLTADSFARSFDHPSWLASPA